MSHRKRECIEKANEVNMIKKRPRVDNGVAENSISNSTLLLYTLPNELLAKVINLVKYKDLINLELVDKKIRNIVFNNILYGKKTLDLEWTSINSYDIKHIAECCPMLEKLNLKCFSGNFDIDYALEFLFKHCENIYYLNLHGCSNIFGNSFKFIPIQIKYLNLCYCDKITSNGMELLADQTKNLETLILDSFSAERGWNSNEWLGKLNKLKYLQLTHFCNDFPLNFSHMKDLKMLSLKQNFYIGADSLRTLESCTKLSHLDLKNTNCYLKANELEILKKCKNIKFCNFGKISNSCEIVEFVKAKQIQSLAINDCRYLPDEVVKSLISECDTLSMLEIGKRTTQKISHLSFHEESQKRKSLITIFINRMDNVMKEMETKSNYCEIKEYQHYNSLSYQLELSIANSMTFD